MDPGLESLEILILPLPEGNLSDENRCPHINLGNDIVHHDASLVDLTLQPRSVRAINRILALLAVSTKEPIPITYNTVESTRQRRVQVDDSRFRGLEGLQELRGENVHEAETDD